MLTFLIVALVSSCQTINPKLHEPFPYMVSDLDPNRPLSAAMHRSFNHYPAPTLADNELYSQFKYTKLQGFDYNGGDGTITRRDPSKVLLENGKYYVWYTKRHTKVRPAGARITSYNVCYTKLLRMKGTRFQVWENDYNNTITGESGFVYPEFKGFFSSLYWSKVKGNNNNGFTVYCRTPHTYLRMLTPAKPAEDKNGRLNPKFPEGDISFVMNIPGIGTKFQDPETMGPHGNTEHYFGNDDHPIVLDLTFEF